MSKRRNPDDSICDLRSREGTILKRIGFYFLDGSKKCEPAVPVGLTDWAKEKEMDVVVWTGLGSNFEEQTKQQYSTQAAIEYLQSLETEGKLKSTEYIRHAPQFVRTDLREALKVESWFQNSKPS